MQKQVTGKMFNVVLKITGKTMPQWACEGACGGCLGCLAGYAIGCAASQI
ncbi:hypothetical protein [Bacillus wiedmannii]|nr:hypothetical protein [Bacillus wiedmannii]